MKITYPPIGQDLNAGVQEALAPIIGMINKAKQKLERDSKDYMLYQHAGNALICTAMGIQAQCEQHDNFVNEAGKQPDGVVLS